MRCEPTALEINLSSVRDRAKIGGALRDTYQLDLVVGRNKMQVVRDELENPLVCLPHKRYHLNSMGRLPRASIFNGYNRGED